MTNLVICGAGGHGKVVADAAAASGEFELVGFLDDDPGVQGGTVAGLRVIGGSEDDRAIEEAGAEAGAAAVGDPGARDRVGRLLEGEGLSLPVIIHPAASVSPSAKIGPGTVVLAGAVVGPEARVGRLVIVNHNAVVDHDCRVGDLVHVAPAAVLGGESAVGPGTLVGAGAVVLPGISVGGGCTVGAGAVVTADVADGQTVVGAPARPR